jgi:hypothetical protein
MNVEGNSGNSNILVNPDIFDVGLDIDKDKYDFLAAPHIVLFMCVWDEAPGWNTRRGLKQSFSS